MAGNPRRANGTRRRAATAWLRAQGLPCWICGLPIDYGAPHGDPLAFECDELMPVSRGGSPYDRGNLAPAHRCCNNWRRALPAASVERIRAAVFERFGPCSSPQQFVARAKEVKAGAVPARPVEPPRPTTDW